MKRPTGAELRIRRQANRNVVPRTLTGELALGSPLPHCWYDGQTLSQNNPTAQLDRGCVSRRKTSRKVREVRKVLKTMVLCGLKFFGGLTSAIQKGFWLRRKGLAGRSVSPPVD